MIFKGVDDWIEIFKGGKQVDSSGKAHDGNALIEKALATFDPATHEPPLTVGHPADNAPAFGWVADLKKAVKDGVPVLLAKFRQVVPEFAAAVKDGLYKKRSASFYPDGRLRHVGFLGAAPPAVKALADLSFEDVDAAVFEFTDVHQQQKEEKKMEFKELIEFLKFWKESGPAPSPAEPAPGATASDPPKSFTEADVEAARKKAAEEAAEAERKKVEAEFAEKAREDAREARKKAIAAWYDQNLKAGKIAPAWGDAGLRAFMESLPAEAPMEFSEGKKETPFDWFKGFIEGLPKVVAFKEIAGRKTDLPDGDAAKRDKLITEFMEQNKVSYKDALLEVSKAHPELFQQ